MKALRIDSSSRHLRSVIASSLLLFTFAALSGTASAGTVTFSFSYTCNIDIQSNCNVPSDLLTAKGPGTASFENGVAINTLQSNSSGPFTVTGGDFAFTSAVATGGSNDTTDWYALYDAAGGNGVIKGSVFGLGAGSTLLTISTFLPGGASYGAVYAGEFFGSNFDGDPGEVPFEGVIDATALQGLGLNPAFTHGYGTVFDQSSFDGRLVDVEVLVTFSQAPEPSSFMLLASGALGVASVVRRRLGR